MNGTIYTEVKMKDKRCKNLAKYRYTWPRKDESFICDDHVNQLAKVAEVIGLHLQIIPLSEKDLEMRFTCKQIVE